MSNSKVEFIIRESGEEDTELVLKFRKLLFQEMGVADELLLDDIDTVLFELYEKEFKEGRIKHFITYNLDNKPVDVAGTLIKTDFPYYLFKPGFYGWVIDVYTMPEYRGNGLAARLLELNKQWLIDKGGSELKLIASGADARRLYEKVGFKPTWEMSLNLTGVKTYNDIIDSRK